MEPLLQAGIESGRHRLFHLLSHLCGCSAQTVERQLTDRILFFSLSNGGGLRVPFCLQIGQRISLDIEFAVLPTSLGKATVQRGEFFLEDVDIGLTFSRHVLKGFDTCQRLGGLEENGRRGDITLG